MEVQEAVDFLEEVRKEWGQELVIIDDVLGENDPEWDKFNNNICKIIRIINLLKSLEASNKVYKEWNKELSIENEELNRLATIKYGKQLEAENKALKKENQAYREMWKSICGYINNFHKDSTTSGILDTRKVIGRIEQKYLGGGK
jgi:FtsZ-binding cell division protein ZapB